MNLPPNVYAVKDRHGKTRYRLRRIGHPSRYIHGEPGTQEFLSSYEECLNPNYVPQRRRRLVNRRLDIRAYIGRSCVYFIGNTKGAVKIGTTINLPARLKKLQTGSPIRLRVLACVDGGTTLEAQYHARFSGLRVNGEWFLGAEVRAEIYRLRTHVGVQPAIPSHKVGQHRDKL